MNELEEIKRRKIEESTRKSIEKQGDELREQIEIQQQIGMLENIAKQYLSKEAISRYGNLKAGHPDKAIQVIAVIAQAAQLGQIKEKLNDEQFKEILMQIQKPKKEFKITKR